MYVDAGCLTVIDYDYLIENGADFSKPHTDKVYRIIETGENPHISFFVGNTYNGSTRGDGKIISMGKLYVGDACYAFRDDEHEKWHAFLDKTDYLNCFGDKGIQINTGGDGDFTLELTIDGKKHILL